MFAVIAYQIYVNCKKLHSLYLLIQNVAKDSAYNTLLYVSSVDEVN